MGKGQAKVRDLYALLGGSLVGAGGAAFSLLVKPGWARPCGIEGVGWVVLALVIFGDKLPSVAAQAGRALRELRTMANTAKQDLRDGLGPEFADFDPADLNPKNFVRKHLFDDLDIDVRPFGIGVAGSRRQGREVEVDEGVADLEDGNARRMPGDLPVIGHFELGLNFDD